MSTAESLTRLYNPSEVAITVTTYYPGWRPGTVQDISDTVKVRGDLCTDFVTTAANLEHPVVIIDAGSSPEFLATLPKEDVLVVPFDRKNFGLQKREAILVASQLPNVRIIFRTEPEKIDVLNSLSQLCQPIIEGEAAIVVGNRKDEEFRESYPDYAYESEMRFNKCYHNILQLAGILPASQYLDLYSGFIALRNIPEVLHHFKSRYEYLGPRDTVTRKGLTFDGWSHAQVFSIISALNQKLPVRGVTIPFRYSETQKLNEEHPDNILTFMDKRRSQRLVGLTGGIVFVRYLLGDRSQLREEVLCLPKAVRGSSHHF